MHEILFKAKTTVKEVGEFNNVWVEGDLINSNAKYYIHPKNNAVSVSGELGKIIVMHEVDPTTICRYTGLCDKNGRKIWENDILDCQDRITVVKWNVPCGTWDSVFVRYKGQLCSNGINVAEWKYRAEVIGNRFDNLNLLEGGN